MNAELRQQIENLHSQLGKVRSVDTSSRALLITLLADITRLLEQSGGGAPDPQTLTERLDDLAVQFEAEHPSLGTALRRVVDALGKAGI